MPSERGATAFDPGWHWAPVEGVERRAATRPAPEVAQVLGLLPGVAPALQRGGADTGGAPRAALVQQHHPGSRATTLSGHHTTRQGLGEARSAGVRGDALILWL